LDTATHSQKSINGQAPILRLPTLNYTIISTITYTFLTKIKKPAVGRSTVVGEASTAGKSSFARFVGVLGDRLEAMRNRVVDALENSDGYRMATAADLAKKNPRVTEGLMVAGTGFEPVTFGL
jgi:hypothetical protein